MWDEAEAQYDSLTAWRVAHLPEDDAKPRTGVGYPAEAENLVSELEAYLVAEGEGLNPRVRAQVERRVGQVRELVGDSRAGR